MKHILLFLISINAFAQVPYLPGKPLYSQMREYTSSYYYNPSGQIDSLSQRRNNTFYNAYSFKYEPGGRIAKKISYRTNGTIQNKEVWTYSPTLDTYSRTGSGTSTKYIYTGNVITSTVKKSSDTLEYFVNQTWRNFAKREPLSQTTMRGGVVTGRYTYSYNTVFGMNHVEYLVEYPSYDSLNAVTTWFPAERSNRYFFGTLPTYTINEYIDFQGDSTWKVAGEQFKFYDETNRIIKDSTTTDVIDYFYSGGNMRLDLVTRIEEQADQKEESNTVFNLNGQQVFETQSGEVPDLVPGVYISRKRIGGMNKVNKFLVD
jgi:hypothetical protein